VAKWKWEEALVQALYTGFIVLFVSGIFGHSLFRRTWYIYAALGLVLARLEMNEHPAPDEAHE